MPAVHDDPPGRLDRIEAEIAAKSRLWMQAVWAGSIGDEYLMRELEELRSVREIIDRGGILPGAG